MAHGGSHVVCDGREVHVRDAFLQAELPNEGRDGGIVAMAYTREEVMLDLVVESTIQKAQKCTTDIATRRCLLVEETLGIANALLIEHFRPLEVMTDYKEKTQIEASGHIHHEYWCKAGQTPGLIHRVHSPPQQEKYPRETVENSLPHKQFGHCFQMRPIP